MIGFLKYLYMLQQKYTAAKSINWKNANSRNYFFKDNR
jgi:hypothetical protein